MGDVIYRSLASELEVQPRGKGGDGRTIVGIAVPYDREQRIDSRLIERFRRGAFDHQLRDPYRIKFARDHLGLGGTLIGKTTLLRDDAAGLYGEFRVSPTQVGEETLELVRDGVLTDLSIGFRARQDKQHPGGVTERVTADLREVAVVLEGAYGEAALVSAVRSVDEVKSNLDQARAILDAFPVLPPAA